MTSITRTWPLGQWPAKERAALRNPQAPVDGMLPLVRLRPGMDVTLFSLPIEIDASLGQRAALAGLEALARWKDEPAPTIDGRSRSIVVYLEKNSQLRIVDHQVKFSRRRFRVGESLGTSRKPRVTWSNTNELAVLPLE